MKDTENIDVAVRLNQISDPKVFVEKNSNLSRVLGFIPVSEPRMISEKLCLLENLNDRLSSRDGIIGGYVLIDIAAKFQTRSSNLFLSSSYAASQFVVWNRATFGRILKTAVHH